MKLFRLTQKRSEYDTVKSVVVWAESAGEARRIAATPVTRRDAPHDVKLVSERSWAPKDAFCVEIPLADYPKIVHVHYAAG